MGRGEGDSGAVVVLLNVCLNVCVWCSRRRRYIRDKSKKDNERTRRKRFLEREKSPERKRTPQKWEGDMPCVNT